MDSHDELLIDILRDLSREREPAAWTALAAMGQPDIDDLIKSEEGGEGTRPAPGQHPFGLGDAKLLFGVLFVVIRFVVWLRQRKDIEHSKEQLIKLLEEHKVPPQDAVEIADKYAERIKRATK